jgi:lipopolysaccharide assembly outer membrane protein LptD (OstA)
MKRRLFALLLVLLLSRAAIHAQLPAFGSMPVDIVNADQTYFENGVAVAEGNVIIQYGTTTIYADYGEYHTDTHDVFVRGHVRIYQEGEVFVGERAVYNLETKQLHAANFQGDFYPFRFSANSVSSIGSGAYLVRDGSFTTSDSSIPDYQLRAKSARIYPGQRIIMRNVTMYVGNVPVFWWPYLYQPLRRDMSYTLHPGYYSTWGFFTLSEWNFPIAENWEGRLHLDYREERGAAIGLDTNYRFGPNNESWGRFSSYLAPDSAPPTIIVGGNKDTVTRDRYRVSIQDRVYLTDDLWANININKISDVRMLRDFLPNEYRLDPQPDNVVSLTQWARNYTLSLVYRKQLNTFNDVSEELPELALDVNRHAVAEGSNLFYDGESSAARLRLAFAQPDAPFQDYHYDRIDTYHELIYPMEFWKFLSFVPRVGLRGDYYTNQGAFNTEVQDTTVENLLPNNTDVPTVVSSTSTRLITHGAIFRGVVDGGFESSFKFSREYPGVESRAWGLDDLRHVVQPYVDLSLAETSVDPSKLLQIDRFQPSTQLPIFDFPQFTGIDTISNWAVVQVGFRNRLETKRDNRTFTWFGMNTFVDVNLKEPTFATGSFHQGIISNLYNRMTFAPVPWVNLTVNSQTPLDSHGFNQINTTLSYMATKDLQFNIGNEYLNHDPFFADENLVDVGFYYRINDNWSFSARDEYEFVNSTLENQVYQVHRDLSSWVASFGVQVENNGPGSNPRLLYAVLFTMTLKDLPGATIPFTFDPDSIDNKSP